MVISTEELEEMGEYILGMVRATGMSCFVIGDLESNTIFSFVLGNETVARGALDALGMGPEVQILTEFRYKESDDECVYH